MTVYLVDQKPIWLNVALSKAVIFSYKGMIAAFRREGLLTDKEVENGLEVFGLAAAFDRLCIVFLEAVLIVDVKH